MPAIVVSDSFSVDHALSVEREIPPFALQDDAPAMQVLRLTDDMRRGDENAFARFHKSYFQRLRRYALVLTRGDEARAADVVQETLIRVVRHVKPMESEAVLWSWLCVLARSAATDLGRKRTRYRRLLDRFAEWKNLRNAGREGGVEGTGLSRLLNEALKGLPEKDRELLENHYIERIGYRVLAERHGTTERAIEGRMARLRVKVRREISRIEKQEESK